MKIAIVRILTLASVPLALMLAAPAQAQNACTADLDGDDAVGGGDLAVLLGSWGSCSSCDADFDASGLVDGGDLATLLGLWGTTCEPLPWATVLEFAPDPSVVTLPQLRNAIVATGLPWRVRDNASQIEMLLVPPGLLNMGCSPSNTYGCGADEHPVHLIGLTGAFYLGRYEVTQSQWQSLMGSNPSQFKNFSDSPNRPVEQVSWNTVQGFLSVTGLRLPSEAEWEFACRAGTSTAFHSMPQAPNGTNDDSLVGNIAWYGSNNGAPGSQSFGTKAVGGKVANALGLHDMLGNASEWVNDWYSSTYYGSSPSTNPPGPASGTDHVLRGGSWFGFSLQLRASYRYHSATSGGLFDSYGFRVAKTP